MSKKVVILPSRAPAIRRRVEAEDATLAEVAEEEGCSITAVRMFCKRHGIKSSRGYGPREGMAANTQLDPAARARVEAELRSGKKSQAQIARESGISRQRISQIAKGLKTEDPGGGE